MKRLIPILVILGLVGYFGFRAWEKSNEAKRNDLFYGTVEVDETLISAQAPGQLVEYNVEEGQKVEKGQLLARIDDAAYQAQLGQARAAVRTVGSQKQVVKATEGGVNTELNRTQKLLATGASPAMQLDLLSTQKNTLQAQQQAIAAQVGQAQAVVKLAETQLGFTRIVAPIAGTVLRTHARLGETVFPGSALLALADLQNAMLVYVYVPEPMLGKIKLGQPVQIFTDSYPGKPLPGTVSYIADTAEFTPKNVQTKDERVRLVYKVKVAAPNPDGVLKIGMPVDVRFAAR
jgi:HlyD family secretion protein